MNTDILNTNISSLKFLTSDQNDNPRIKGKKKVGSSHTKASDEREDEKRRRRREGEQQEGKEEKSGES